jgi:hypothetical protein
MVRLLINSTTFGDHRKPVLGIDESDRQVFMGHLDATLDYFEVSAPERAEVLSFINSTKPDILAQSPASRA